MNEIERLARLSEKATQGEWQYGIWRFKPDVDRFLITAGDQIQPKESGFTIPDQQIAEFLALANAEFIAALVNWFRANHQSLSQESVRSEAVPRSMIVELERIEAELKRGRLIGLAADIRDIIVALQSPARVAEGESKATRSPYDVSGLKEYPGD